MTDKINWMQNVEVICSNNSKVGSRLISWATKRRKESLSVKEIPSHVSLLFFGKVVIESTLFKGVGLRNFFKYEKSDNILSRELVPVENASELLEKMLKNNRNTMYDWVGAVYLGIKRISYRAFGIEFKKENNWQKENKDFCVELLESIEKYKDRNLSDVSPLEIHLEIIGEKYVIS